MYSGTKIEMHNGGTFPEQPFTDEQRVQGSYWKEWGQYTGTCVDLFSL